MMKFKESDTVYQKYGIEIKFSLYYISIETSWIWIFFIIIFTFIYNFLLNLNVIGKLVYYI